MLKLTLKVLTAASLSLAVGNLASAADMPTKAPPVAPPVVYNWTGFYIGGHGGYGWGNAKWDSDFNCAVARLCEHLNQDPKGWVAGLQGGYRYQFGQWVLGLEGTYSWSHIRTTDPSPCTPGVDTCIGVPGGFGVTEEIRIRNLGTVTGQFGYAWDRLLWYGKGGWARGEIRRSSADTLGVPAAQFFSTYTQSKNGWTAGTGLEYMFWQNFSFGVEYNYVKLNADNFDGNALSGTGAVAFRTVQSGVSAHAHEVLARLNWKLWGGPPWFR